MGCHSIASSSRFGWLVIIASITVIVMSVHAVPGSRWPRVIPPAGDTAGDVASAAHDVNKHRSTPQSAQQQQLPADERAAKQLWQVIARRKPTEFYHDFPDGAIEYTLESETATETERSRFAEASKYLDFHVDVIMKSAYTTLLIFKDAVYEVKPHFFDRCRGGHMLKRPGCVSITKYFTDHFCLHKLTLEAMRVDNAADEGYMYYAPKSDSTEGFVFDPRYENVMRGEGQDIRRFATTYNQGGHTFQIVSTNAKVSSAGAYNASPVWWQRTGPLAERRPFVKYLVESVKHSARPKTLHYTVSAAGVQQQTDITKTAEAVLWERVKELGKITTPAVAGGHLGGTRGGSDHTPYPNYLEYKLGVKLDDTEFGIQMQFWTYFQNTLHMLDAHDIKLLERDNYAALVLTALGAFAVLPKQSSFKMKNGWAYDSKMPYAAFDIRYVRYPVPGPLHQGQEVELLVDLVHVPVAFSNKAGERPTHVAYFQNSENAFTFALEDAKVHHIEPMSCKQKSKRYRSKCNRDVDDVVLLPPVEMRRTKCSAVVPGPYPVDTGVKYRPLLHLCTLAA